MGQDLVRADATAASGVGAADGARFVSRSPQGAAGSAADALVSNLIGGHHPSQPGGPAEPGDDGPPEHGGGADAIPAGR